MPRRKQQALVLHLLPGALQLDAAARGGSCSPAAAHLQPSHSSKVSMLTGSQLLVISPFFMQHPCRLR